MRFDRLLGVRSLLLAVLVGIGLLSVPTAVAVAAPGPDCGSIGVRVAQFEQEGNQYNAEVRYINSRGGGTREQVFAYNARRTQLLARQSALVGELRQCQSQGQATNVAPPRSIKQAPPRGGKPAPPQANPTPGYPAPRPYPPGSGVTSDQNFSGSRVVEFRGGGRLTYLPLQGRSASGSLAFVTRSMLGKGTPTARTSPTDVTPPGFGGRFNQRGHLLAERLGGSGSDARNIVALTRKANAEMRTVENRVFQRLGACKAPGARVTYTVTPVFERGVGLPPTRIIMLARGPCGINEFRNIANT